MTSVFTVKSCGAEYTLSDVIVLDIQSVYSVISRERKVKPERGKRNRVASQERNKKIGKKRGRKSKTVALYAKKKRE